MTQASQYEFRNVIRLGYEAAQRIVPEVVQVIGRPNSVVDLGGGAGGWSLAFREHGARQAVCIDHPSVADHDLLIPREDFRACDFLKSMPAPVASDLAVSIEVAEHLPASLSEALVAFLTQSADVVLFSAAIPQQGGHKHINEQRPAYWRRLFASHGFERLDAIRPRIIGDIAVPWWLRQNILLYVRQPSTRWDELHEAVRFQLPDDMEIVSTQILTGRTTGVRGVLASLPTLIKRGVMAHVLRQPLD